MSTDTPMARRAMWQQRLDNWQHSGLSSAEWCRQQQLPEHQFFYWKRKLLSVAENKLIPVAVTAGVTETLPGNISIYLPSGLRIETETTDVVALIHRLEAL